jgi:hypothetical protein
MAGAGGSVAVIATSCDGAPPTCGLTQSPVNTNGPERLL